LASAHVAQLVERVLGKDEVISSTLIMGSRFIINNENSSLTQTTLPGDNDGKRAISTNESARQRRHDWTH
jgi:hypothetical protein